MIQNYLKIALRQISRHKGYAAINLIGLAVGMAATILIFLFVNYEMSYDRYHRHADQVYRLNRILTFPNELVKAANTASAQGPALQAEFPPIESICRFMIPYPNDVLITYEHKQFYEKKVLWADSTVFDMFSFSLLKGNPNEALKQPFTVTLSESTARKYFGEKDAIGQRISIDGWSKMTTSSQVYLKMFLKTLT